MQSHPNIAKIEQLSKLIEDILLPEFQNGRPFALVDFPDHPNLGDSAIYLGEVAFMERHRLRPSYVCQCERMDWDMMARALGPDDTILIHGGGNFGDIWPRHHDFREQVLERFSNHRIIQLPQTVHFDDPAKTEQTARLIANARSFLLLVRDQPSFDFATKHFDCETRLCPDMAFAMGPLTRAKPTHDLLFLLRSDKEVQQPWPISPWQDLPNVLVDDWLGEDEAAFGRLMKRKVMLNAMLSFPIPMSRMELRRRLFEAKARTRVERAIAFLSRGQTVVTDRLHGHILSLIAGIPHGFLDNNYGKLTNYSSAWGTAGPNSVQIEGEDALKAFVEAALHNKTGTA